MSLTAIVDGNNTFLRANYVYGNLTTKSGQPTGGVYGSITTMVGLQNNLPSGFTNCIWTFDWGRSFFRQAVRSTYKSNRLTVEREDAAPQFRLLEEFLSIIKVPFVRVEGIEADDIIASLAKQIEGDKIIVTWDHDLLQLCDDQTVVARVSVGGNIESLLDASDVKLKYGLAPDRLAELWALQGEPGDGIEGIPKVGVKTASKLLAEYGTVWDVIEKAPKCVGFGTRVIENYAMIDLVHDSTGIKITNDFDTSFDPTFYPEDLRKFFLRLEMNTFVRRFDERKLWNAAKKS